MNQGRFDFFEDHFAAGRRLLADYTEKRLENAAPELLALVRRAGGAGLLEPLLHAWMAHEEPAIGLEQILFGYLREEDRPRRIPVRANHAGLVHLPRIGTLRTGVPDGRFELRASPGDSPTLWAEGQPGVAIFTGLQTVPGTQIELHRDLHPLLPRFFPTTADLHEVEVERATSRCLPALTRALELLAQAAPDLLVQLERDCRSLMVLESRQVESFATMWAYGLACLSVPAEPNELSFCEDLIHQIGHISFFAITSQACFTIRANTPLALFTVLKHEQRTLHAAFHGNYTIMRTAQFFDACLEHGKLDESLQHELIGRFALAMTRFEDGLLAIDDERCFTPLGWELHRGMIQVFEDISRRRGRLLEPCDVANQPPVFDYRTFCARNPYDEEMALTSSSFA